MIEVSEGIANRMSNLADPRPIDEEFILSQGFYKWKTDNCVFQRKYHSTGETIELHKAGDSVYVVYLFCVPLKTKIQSRGDLSRLIAALGF